MRQLSSIELIDVAIGKYKLNVRFVRDAYLQIRFPAKFDDLNMALESSKNIFLHISCFEENLFFYSPNSAPLISSGTLEICVKDELRKAIV